MVSLVAVIIWRRPLVVVLLGFLVFGTLDGLYLSSALTKIPDGAWFTLALAILLSSIFILWRYGKENQWRAEATDRLPLRRLFSLVDKDDNSQDTICNRSQSTLRLAAGLGGASISPIKGMGIFFDKTGDRSNTPTVFIQFLQKFQAVPSVVVFFHIRPLSRPTVNPEDRFTISRCFGTENVPRPVENTFQVTLRHGYTDEVVNPDLGMLLYEQLRKFVIHEARPEPTVPVSKAISPSDGSGSSSAVSGEPVQPHQIMELHQREKMEDSVRLRLDSVKAAYEDQVVYVVGKEQMRIRESRNAKDWGRRTALAAFLWIRGNTGNKVANLNLDVEKLVELGFVKVV